MPRKTQEEKLAVKAKRARIVDLHKADGDWHRLETELNVPKTTPHRWIKEGVRVDDRGGSYNQKITTEHKGVMCSFIENNPRITLAQIVEKLHLKYALTISKTTVFRHLDMSVYTLKSVRYEPERANTPENKEKRKVLCKPYLIIKVKICLFSLWMKQILTSLFLALNVGQCEERVFL